MHRSRSPPATPQITSCNSNAWVDAATQDFQHVVFETDPDLTPDAVGNYIKLCKTDGTTTHLITPAGPNCPGGTTLPFGVKASY